jgi:ATP-dependent Clp protease protease subunit
MKKFWNFKEVIRENEGKGKERELYLEGPISTETWFGDEITPQEFKNELNQGTGDITVCINSPGGDVFAASEIYSALKKYPGKVTVEIDSLAASAASIIAMSGDLVKMSPTAYLAIHNPWTIMVGNSEEMRITARQLDEIKEGVINAYQIKTGLSREKISQMMNDETYINATEALKLGFIDKIMYASYEPHDSRVAFSQKMATNRVLAKIRGKPKIETLDYNKYYEILNNLNKFGGAEN